MKTFTTIIFCLLAFGQQATQPKAIPAPDPPTITVSKTASLEFQNMLLQINLLRAQAEAATARADQMQSLIPDKVKAIADEGKVDTTKYRIARNANGSFTTDENGQLQFTLIKKD